MKNKNNIDTLSRILEEIENNLFDYTEAIEVNESSIATKNLNDLINNAVSLYIFHRKCFGLEGLPSNAVDMLVTSVTAAKSNKRRNQENGTKHTGA